MCEVNDPRILNAYIAMIEDEPTDWLILGYKDSRNSISLYTSGTNGLSGFRSSLTNEILFGYIRIDGRFILITYVPDSVSGVRRARALVHSRSVAHVLELSHAQITASSLSDLSDANVRTRLKLTDTTNQRPRPTSMSAGQQASKRSSLVTRRRKSGSTSSNFPPPLFPPSPSPSPRYYSPSPSFDRNLNTLIMTDEPLDMTQSTSIPATPTPSSPTTSVTTESTLVDSLAVDALSTIEHLQLEKKKQYTDDLIEIQLAKKKELEEARFRQFQKDQQEEKFKKRWTHNSNHNNNQQQMLQHQIETLKPVVNNKRNSMPLESTLALSSNNHVLEKKKSLTVFVNPNSDSRPSTPIFTSSSSRPTTPSRPITPVIAAAPNYTKELPSLPSIPNQTATTNTSSIPPVLNTTKAPLAKATTSSTPSASNGNTLLSGFLSVQTDNSAFWKRRYFIIGDNKTFSLYKDEMSKDPLSNIDLSNNNVSRLSLVDQDEDIYVRNSIMLTTKSNESLQLLADDKKTIHQVLSTLKYYIQ